MIDWNLQGKTIAVPEMRELAVFSALLERRGATVLRCPLVTIYDSPHSAQVLAFAVKLAEEGLLALEVEVEGALREAAGGGDVFDAGAHDAVLDELGACCAEQ